MLNTSFEAFRLKDHLEKLTRAPTIENANVMLREIESIKNRNYQAVQDVFLTTLLTLMDESNGP